MSPSMSDYQAQDDCSTLTRAQDIQTDPKRHAAAKRHARRTIGSMKKIAKANPMRGGR